MKRRKREVSRAIDRQTAPASRGVRVPCPPATWSGLWRPLPPCPATRVPAGPGPPGDACYPPRSAQAPRRVDPRRKRTAADPRGSRSLLGCACPGGTERRLLQRPRRGTSRQRGWIEPLVLMVSHGQHSHRVCVNHRLRRRTARLPGSQEPSETRERSRSSHRQRGACAGG